MKLSSRKSLIAEADKEMQKIQSDIKRREIKSQADWDKFAKDEELATMFSEKWINQIKDLAKKGPITINLKSLNDGDRLEAEFLLSSLKREINLLETGNVLGYGPIYKIVTILTGLLGLLSGLIMYFGDSVDIENQKDIQKSKELTTKLKNAPSPKTTPPRKMLQWIKSIVSMIKK